MQVLSTFKYCFAGTRKSFQLGVWAYALRGITNSKGRGKLEQSRAEEIRNTEMTR